MLHFEQQCIRCVCSLAEHVMPAEESLLLEQTQSCDMQAVNDQAKLL